MLKFLNKRFIIVILTLVGIYTLATWVINIHSERRARIDMNVALLQSIEEVAENALGDGQLDKVAKYFPKGIRVTIIDKSGLVLFDSDSEKVGTFENHISRQELKGAHFNGYGYASRVSKSTGNDTFYYAKFHKDHYVRVSVPNFLTPGLSFSLTRILLLLGILILFFIAWRMYRAYLEHAQHLDKLTHLSKKIANGETIEPIDLPKVESDDITSELLEILKQREQSRRDLVNIRERLILHFEVTNIGIGIFNTDGVTQFTNTHFIQFANMLSSDPITEVSQLIHEPLLEPIKEFLSEAYDPQNRIMGIKCTRNGRTYELQCVRDTRGNELTITDITEAEKNRLLKQELTSNITHELRTPLTAIKGYLEMLSYHDLSHEDQILFTDKALAQSTRLSALLDDISLLSKIEEGTNNYTFETIDLHQLVDEVRVAFTDRFTLAGDFFHNNLPNDVILEGNRSLLTSIFSNLMENTLRYAGAGVTIEVNLYHSDHKYFYLSYHDTGIGVPENHLNRIFERFYRIDEGRTRSKGGTGLGLSIVRNSIAVHGGQAQARRHCSGGLEILFTLQRTHASKSKSKALS